MERVVKVLQEELKYWQDMAYKEAQKISDLTVALAEKNDEIKKLKEIIASKNPF